MLVSEGVLPSVLGSPNLRMRVWGNFDLVDLEFINYINKPHGVEECGIRAVLTSLSDRRNSCLQHCSQIFWSPCA